MVNIGDIHFQDIYQGYDLPPETLLAAAKGVALHFDNDPWEAAEMLDMLGLIPPLEGNEPTTIQEHRASMNRVARKSARKVKREE